MKTTDRILVVLIIMSTALSGCKRNADGQNQKPVDYIYYLGDSPAKKLGDAKKAASTLFGKAILEGTFTVNETDHNTYFVSKDPSVHFQQDTKTGNFSFSNSLKNYMGKLIFR